MPPPQALPGLRAAVLLAPQPDMSVAAAGASPTIPALRLLSVGSMRMKTVAGAGLLAVVIAVASAAGHPVHANAMSVAAGCPKYQAHLRSARSALQRGDRADALAELRQAQEALESCLRENAGESGLAARSLSTAAS